MDVIRIKKAKEEKVCYVEMHNPSKRNCLNFKMINELIRVFQDFYKESSTRVVIFSGRGPHFCSGGDLNWMKLSPDSSDIENLNEVNLLFKLFHTIYQCPLPVITLAQGSVYGGGIGLVATSDFVLAHTETKFCFSELKLNLVPSVISPFVLRKMAFSKAQTYMLSAKTFSAEEALESGLVHFVGDKKEITKYKNNLISALISFDKKSVKKTKELLRFVPDHSIEESKEHCVRTLAERRKSPEVIQKINRFLNKK